MSSAGTALVSGAGAKYETGSVAGAEPISRLTFAGDTSARARARAATIPRQQAATIPRQQPVRRERGVYGLAWLWRYRRLLVALDLVTAGAAVAVAFAARFDWTGEPSQPRLIDTAVALGLPAAWCVTIAMHRGYEQRFVGTGSVEFQRLLRAFAHLTVLVTFVSYVGHAEIARGFALLALPLVFAFGSAGRYLARMRLHRHRAAGAALKPVLVVGGPGAVAALVVRLHGDRRAGLTVVGACLPGEGTNDPNELRNLAALGIPVLGTADSVLDAAHASGACDVVVLSGEISGSKLRWLSWKLERSNIGLIVSAGLTDIGVRRLHIEPVGGLPLLYVDGPQFSGFHRVVKAGFDRAVAAGALVALLPVLLAIGSLVRLTSKGPALFRQTRIGRDGRCFTMIKFRSMRVSADAERAELRAELLARKDHLGGPLFKMRDDPRLNPVGRVLRALSLDELPQLINVLNGSMSLVGPRPPLPEEVAQYGDDARRRLLVKPGITGLWQVSGRSNLSWDETVRLDLHYVENWSLMTDLVILWRTLFVVVRKSGAY